MSVVLRVEKVAKSYGRYQVLEEINFTAGPGEIVGIEGENGTGKSTLLNILAGLLLPDKGMVTIDGCFGFCPQEPQVFETLTVSENLRYFAGAYGLTPENKWQKEAAALLEKFNFRAFEHMQVAKLSGGTRQKLNLAIALLHKPDLLILDEPYAAFDWETYLHFWDYIREVRTHNRSVLMVSHLIYDPTLIDRRYTLKNGMLECI
jgi:ABC-type multidrug transport system ATPase subunit